MVLLLQAMGRDGQAQQELTGALRLFPEDEKLRTALRRLRGRRREPRGAGPGFPQFRRPAAARGKRPRPSSRCLMDPFGERGAGRQSRRRPTFPISRPGIFSWKTISTAAMQKAEEAMEGNPFEPENHHLLALLFLQKQQIAQADLYAQSALFLAETLDNYLLQLKIQQAGMDREKFRKTLALALQKFPQNPELLKLGGRGR